MARKKHKDVDKITNTYKKARLEAAKKNANLSTIDKAGSELGITREKLGQIEQEDSQFHQANPTPGEVLVMINKYNAPELRNYYCTQVCPLGNDMPKLQHYNLSDICFHLLLGLNRINTAQAKLGDILEDGKVSAEEKSEFAKILGILKSISKNTESLEIWAKKNCVLTENK